MARKVDDEVAELIQQTCDVLYYLEDGVDHRQYEHPLEYQLTLRKVRDYLIINCLMKEVE